MVKTSLDEWISMYFDHEKEVREGADPARAAAGMRKRPHETSRDMRASGSTF